VTREIVAAGELLNIEVLDHFLRRALDRLKASGEGR
jgi:DNA repair protein RadC